MECNGLTAGWFLSVSFAQSRIILGFLEEWKILRAVVRLYVLPSIPLAANNNHGADFTAHFILRYIQHAVASSSGVTESGEYHPHV